jgi:hypothetical protein
MKPAKAPIGGTELRVWCESCCIRIAPNEERTVIRGKVYHPHCSQKLKNRTARDV